MIYLANTSEPQSVAIPVEEPWDGTTGTMTLRSTFDAVDIAVGITSAEPSEFGHYALLTVTLPIDLPDGSYEYRLTIGDKVLAGGCCTIGDYTPAVTRYEKTVEYEQYN